MKTVLSTQNVCHAFANETQPEAKNPNRTVYFNDGIIYSYGSHFPMAKHVTNKKGVKALLFTTRSYSNTTAKHLSHLYSASRHLNKIFVDHVNFSPRDNFEAIEKQVKPLTEKILRARMPQYIVNEISGIYENAKKYAEFEGVKIPKTLQKLFDYIESKEVTDHIEKRAIKNKELNETREKREEEKREANRIKQAENLAKWKNFNFAGSFYGLGRDFLRYNADKQRIETTQGIEVPERIAKTFYNSLVVTLKAGGCVDCQGENLNLMNQYQTREVNEQHVKIGCHVIDWTEINELAKKLNWIK